MSKTINLGRVATCYKGIYNGSTQYTEMDIVSYQGSSYIAKQDAKGIVPTNTDYWDVCSAKGDKGETGDDGKTGPKGDPGDPGQRGERGFTGYTFTPHVSEEGLLSWSNNGDLSNPGVVNIKGPKGDPGAIAKVVDNLESDNPEDALSARQGKALSKRNIITASFSENHVIAKADTAEKVSLDTFVVEGEKLTLVNNGILIGEGISKIKVSSNVNFQTCTAGLKYVSIYKNDEVVSQNPTTISARTTITNSPILIDVAEGDMIYLYIQGTASDTIRRAMAFSNITVEVIK